LGGMPVHLKVIIATEQKTNKKKHQSSILILILRIFVLYLLSVHSIPFIPLLTIYILLFVYHSLLNIFYFCTTPS
jgi:hypothetical protein